MAVDPSHHPVCTPPHQQQARPQSPDLIWVIKTFFFSTNFSPPSPSPLVLSASLVPSPIDHHTEEITLIAGITSPHVGYTQGGGGGHVRHDVQVCDEGGGPGNAKSGPLGKDL